MVKIRLDYEYDCGGHTHSSEFELGNDEFENDKLFVLVCSYMQTWGGYPGKDIDQYLHNKFPKYHVYDDMYGVSVYNVYSCSVLLDYDENLKGFPEMCDGMLHLNAKDGEIWVKMKCKEFNERMKGQKRGGFSIWK